MERDHTRQTGFFNEAGSIARARLREATEVALNCKFKWQNK